MKSKLILGLVSIVLSSAALAQKSPTAPALTRAEVAADTALWKRAGLEELEQGEGRNVADGRYESRLAEYHRMRSGPEFTAEVRRAQERGASDRMSAAARPVPMTYWN